MTDARRRPRGLPRRGPRPPPGELPRLPAHPEHLGHAGARRRLPARPPTGWPAGCAAIGLEHVEVVRDRRPPDRLRRLAPRRRARRPSSSTATTTSSRSTRSTSGTSPPFEPVVVGDRVLARGAERRQGATSRSSSRPPRRSWRPGAAAGQPALRLRGRGGVELGPPRAVAARPTAAAWPATSRSSATSASSRATCRRSRSACAGIDVRPDRRHRARSRTSTPAATAGRSRTRPTPWPRSSPRSRGPTAGSGSPGFYDDVVPLAEARPGGLRRAAVRRGGLPRRRSASRRSSARPGYTTLERQERPADPRRQRDLGRLPGRGQQDDHPRPGARQGQLPARRRPGPGPDLRAPPGPRRWRSPRRASGSRSRDLGGGPAEPDLDRPPGRPGRRPGPRGDVRAAAALHPRGRLDPVRGHLRASPRACRSSSWASCPPDGNFHAPNEWMDLANFEAGIRAVVRYFDELARAAAAPMSPVCGRCRICEDSVG